MYDFEIKRTLNKDQVPPSRGRKKRDYSKLIRSVATLEKDEVLEVEVEKRHVIEGIKNKLDKEFKHTRYTVTSRTDKENGVINVYIIREG